MWGEQNHKDGTHHSFKSVLEECRSNNTLNIIYGNQNWLAILLEEVYEVASELSPTALKEELVQVAAVAVAWLECIDRREEE